MAGDICPSCPCNHIQRRFHMKKLLLFLSLLLVLLLAVAACDKKSGEAETQDGSTEAIQETTQPAEPGESPSDISTEAPTEAPTVPPEWLTYTETEKIIDMIAEGNWK